jgi:hypothetical protein
MVLGEGGGGSGKMEDVTWKRNLEERHRRDT